MRREVCASCHRLWPRNARRCGNCGASGSMLERPRVTCVECGTRLAHAGEHCWECRVNLAEEIDPDFWKHNHHARQAALSREVCNFFADLMANLCRRGAEWADISQQAGLEMIRQGARQVGESKADEVLRSSNGQADLDPAYYEDGTPAGRTITTEARTCPVCREDGWLAAGFCGKCGATAEDLEGAR